MEEYVSTIIAFITGGGAAQFFARLYIRRMEARVDALEQVIQSLVRAGEFQNTVVDLRDRIGALDRKLDDRFDAMTKRIDALVQVVKNGGR